MKTFITRAISTVFLLAVFYFVITDGMINHFECTRDIQYAFNMGAIFVLIPLGLHFLLGMNNQEDEV